MNLKDQCFGVKTGIDWLLWDLVVGCSDEVYKPSSFTKTGSVLFRRVTIHFQLLTLLDGLVCF
jgi:hypothetical protein